MAKKMYLVIWEIALEAENPREAAAEALKIQREVGSEATEFDVMDDSFAKVRVDLGE